MQTLAGKCALVTGAGQGVGLGIAKALAREGTAVALVGRTEAKLLAAAEQLDAIGAKSITLAGDVRDPAFLAHAVAATAEALGGIDILVNNAQEVPLGALLDVSDADFTAGFESGPLATLRLMRLVHPIMKARGGGAIVNLATAAAKRWDMSGYGAYAAVKQATRSLTRAAAAEWGVDGIRVNTIAPYALSPALADWAKARPEEAAAFNQTVPLRRAGDCETDIGRAVVFLVSPASGYVTGATLPLDGGQANFD